MNKNELYDNKYESSSLSISPYFKRQFEYLCTHYMDKKCLKVLDLGGGTGEYSLIINQLGHDVTLFDFSEVAIKRAKDLGVRSVICDDLLSYDFKDLKYDIVLVKGFSLLNTDNEEIFFNHIEIMRNLLKKGGCIIYWGQTNLSNKWSESGWFEFGHDAIEMYFDKYLIFPGFRYQTYLPLIFNKVISSIVFKFNTLSRSMTLVGIIK